MIVKNISNTSQKYAGMILQPEQIYTVEHFEIPRWQDDENLFPDILLNKVTVDGMDKKAYRNLLIDNRTQELILEGFSYSGEVFGLSQTDQNNWSGLKNDKDWQPYPLAITTKNNGEFIFENASEVFDFYVAGKTIVATHYGTGRALKLQINSSTTDAEIDAVMDMR